MSLGMDSLPEPTECQGQRDHYVTGSFWGLWSLTGELVDGFAVSITQSLFKGNLKRAEALGASRFMTGQCWRDLPIHSSKHFWVACPTQGHGGRQSSPRIFFPPNNFLQILLQEYRILKPSKASWEHLQRILGLLWNLLPVGDAGNTSKGKSHPY